MEYHLRTMLAISCYVFPCMIYQCYDNPTALWIWFHSYGTIISKLRDYVAEDFFWWSPLRAVYQRAVCCLWIPCYSDPNPFKRQQASAYPRSLNPKSSRRRMARGSPTMGNGWSDYWLCAERLAQDLVHGIHADGNGDQTWPTGKDCKRVY